MAQQTLNATAGGPDDNLPTATAKLNSMFNELYALQSRTLNAADPRFAGATDEISINNAINMPAIGAVAVGAARVRIPSSMLPFDATQVTFNAAVQMVREGGDDSAFDIWAYGADPSGVVDATVAIQAALTAASPAVADAATGLVNAPTGLYHTSTKITIPAKVRLLGVGRSSTVFQALAGFPADTPMFQLGVTGALAFGCRIENCSVYGGALFTPGLSDIGIYSDCIQEQSGIVFVTCSNHKKKCIHIASKTAQAVRAQNYFLRDSEASLATNSDATAIAVHLEGDNNAAKTEIGNMTTNAADGVTTVPGVGFKFEGLTGHIRNLHPEHTSGGGVVIGEVTPCIALTIDGIYGGIGTPDMVRLGNQQNDELTLTGLQLGLSTTLVRDNFTGMVLTDLRLGFYHTGVINNGAVPNYPLLKQTVVSATLGAGNNNNYALPAAFQSSAQRTGTVRVTTDAAGSTITGIAGGLHGRPLKLFVVGGAGALTIAHANANSSAVNRILSPTGADVVGNSTNDVFFLEYDGQSQGWRLVNWQV